MRIVLYAPEGVGKSTWAANSINPVFICSEDGTSNLDVTRFPPAESFNDIMDAISTLYSEDHDFNTVALDSIDWVENLIRDAVCEQHHIDSIEAIPYGKGWVFAQDIFMQLLRALDALHRKGMHVIVIAHSQIKTFNDPALDSGYDRYMLKLDKRNEPLLKEWCDCLFFANFDTILTGNVSRKTGEIQGKAKGRSYGKRLMYTQRTAAYDAKSRFDLPESMPLDWDIFWRNYQASINQSEKKS